MVGITNKINLCDDIFIDKGNFAFVLDKFDSDEAGKESIYQCCLDAESKLMTDYEGVLFKFRILYETLGYEAEVRKICKEQQIPYADARKVVDEGINSNKRNTNASTKPYTKKIMLGDEMKRLLHNSNRCLSLKKMIRDGCTKLAVRKNGDEEEALVPLLAEIYRICSEPHHVSGAGTRDKAEKIAQIMYGLVAVDCEYEGCFDIKRCPIDDYFPIPSICLSKIGISNESIRMYVREQPSIQYFIFKPKWANTGLQSRRDVEVLDVLWNQTLNTPNNIIYIRNDIGNEDHRMQIMNLPAKPETLDYAITNLTIIEKWEAIRQIIEALQSLHHMEPVVTHRALCPLDFFICRTSKGIRTILYQFEYAKQWGVEDGYTVANRLRKVSDLNIRSKFIDTKLLLAGINEENACKADIFSLGELIRFILGNGLDERTRLYTELMAKESIHDRPSIDEVHDYFYGNKSGLISCSLRSICNPNKKETQDAFLCCGCSDVYGNDYSFYGVGTLPYYAGVLDGLGGAYGSEGVSRFAAGSIREQLRNGFYNKNEKQFLDDLARTIQGQTLEHMNNEELDYAGTTIALLLIDDNMIHVENIGDSRVYVISDQGMRQLTKDHRYSKSLYNKAELFQYIGMDESDGKLSPYIESYVYGDGGNNYLLLCTDGLTDYVQDDQIKNIVINNASLDEKTEQLINAARVNGLKDDISVVLLKRGL